MTKEIARQLRKNQTETEALLWQQLRGRRLNSYKFRRQYPIAGYVADFACVSESLVVELDGYHHADEAQKAYDDERTRIFEAGGFRVLRFWNEQVQKDMNQVLQQISQALKSEQNNSLSLRERAGVRES